jgi:hypothetical protein
MSDGAAISTEAATANGGNIALVVNDRIHLTGSEITTQVDASTGNGGNITIDPHFLILEHSRIIASALGSGLNGNINIRADAFIESADSIITATGLITFANPPANIGGNLAVLSGELRSATEVLRDSCAARGDRPHSSLTEAGRGGLPQDPEATLLAVHIADRDFAPGPRDATRYGLGGNAALTAVRAKMHCR